MLAAVKRRSDLDAAAALSRVEANKDREMQQLVSTRAKREGEEACSYIEQAKAAEAVETLPW